MMRKKSGQTAEELVKGLVTECKTNIVNHRGPLRYVEPIIKVLFDVTCEAGIRISYQISSTCLHIKSSTVFPKGK